MEKKLIIGFGSGRSGTCSLAKLLNSQKKSHFTHQTLPILPWDFKKEIIDKKINKLLKNKKKYFGEVALYYLNYIDYIIEKFPEAKFIVLKRDKEKVVQSFLEVSHAENVWMHHKGEVWVKTHFDKAFPKYNVPSKREGVSKYYDEYYTRVENLIKKYPDKIKVYDTSELLNNKENIKEMLEFVGYDKEDMRLIKNIRFNKRIRFFPFFQKIFFRFRKYIYDVFFSKKDEKIIRE